jgi:hypothetical protein
MRYARRTDGNHAYIRDTLRKAGVVVFDSSSFGRGFPDLICRHVKTGRTVFLEIKDGMKSPSQRKLTEAEWEFADKFDVFIVLNVEMAFAMVGVGQ